MRNWKPFIADVVRTMIADGVQQVLAICLAPQNSSTSVGLYGNAFMAEMKAEITVRFVDSWHDHPLLVRAFAEKLESAWEQACQAAGAALPVIFTAHSVPTRTITAGDPYEQQTKETAQLVGQSISRLAPSFHQFAFQIQGISAGPWLSPPAH